MHPGHQAKGNHGTDPERQGGCKVWGIKMHLFIRVTIQKMFHRTRIRDPLSENRPDPTFT